MKIAFTSCSRMESFSNQPDWNHIHMQNPDYLFLLGDMIYMDFITDLFSAKNYSPSEFKTEMEKKYVAQWTEPNFQALFRKMRDKNALFGIWDDHDFAWNNAKGATMTSPEEMEKKAISRQLFHQFYENCSTNGDKLYYAIDTPMAKVIFLDNRSYAQEKGPVNDLLGEEQFQFLESQLDHDKEYTLLCGGLTLNKGDENWWKYERDLIRLCKMLENKPKPLFLAGDIHQNQFVERLNYKNKALTPVQIISSGMYVETPPPNGKWAMLIFDENRVRVEFYIKGHLSSGLTNQCNMMLKELW